MPATIRHKAPMAPPEPAELSRADFNAMWEGRQGVAEKPPILAGNRTGFSGPDYENANVFSIEKAVVRGERYSYKAYGERAIFDGSWGARSTSVYDNSVGYTGRWHDDETGLVHFRARMYSPELGRFVSRDPVGYVDGWNLYGAGFVPIGMDFGGLLRGIPVPGTGTPGTWMLESVHEDGLLGGLQFTATVTGYTATWKRTITKMIHRCSCECETIWKTKDREEETTTTMQFNGAATVYLLQGTPTGWPGDIWNAIGSYLASGITVTSMPIDTGDIDSVLSLMDTPPAAGVTGTFFFGKLKVVKVDVTMPGLGEEPKKVDPPHPWERSDDLQPGGIVALNDDDDDGNGKLDYGDGASPKENDLQAVDIRFEPIIEELLPVTISCSGNIKLWEDLGKKKKFPGEIREPTTVFVEGISEGIGSITARYDVAEDTLNVTVVNPDLKMQNLYEELPVNATTMGNNELDPGAFIALNDDYDLDATKVKKDLEFTTEKDPAKENDLVLVEIHAKDKPYIGTISITVPSIVKAWKIDKNSGKYVPQDKFDWDLKTADSNRTESNGWPIPEKLYLEGGATGIAEISIKYSGPVTCDDRIKITVVKVRLSEVGFAGNGQHTLKKTGTANYRYDAQTFASDGDTTINNPVWKDANLDGDVNDAGDKNDPICYTMGSTVTIIAKLKISPNLTAVVPARIQIKQPAGDGFPERLWLEKDVSLKGEELVVNEPLKDPLVSMVLLADWKFVWKLSINGGPWCDVGDSDHLTFLTYATPSGGTVTAKRMHWSTWQAFWATTITEAAEKFRDKLAVSPGYTEPRTWNLDSWKFLDSEKSGDCITLAKLACEGLKMIGIPVQHRWSYPTADGTNGFPAVSGDTCKTKTTKNFAFNGESFAAKLVYTDNNFEAFFTVEDPKIKAYTVYPPDGPFEKQMYYYLQVLRSVTADQFWVWDGDQTKNDVSVNDWDEVPGELHIPVPAVPVDP